VHNCAVNKLGRHVYRLPSTCCHSQLFISARTRPIWRPSKRSD